MSDLISRNDAAVAACDACYRMFGKAPCWDSECIMKRRIDEVKAVDATPVVHGEWISDCICSGCGFVRQMTRSGNFMVGNYCPNCGAKMDGGKQDG